MFIFNMKKLPTIFKWPSRQVEILSTEVLSVREGSGSNRLFGERCDVISLVTEFTGNLLRNFLNHCLFLPGGRH